MKNKWAFIFFIAYLCTGLLIFKDYGISFDEPVQRFMGELNLNYVLSRDPKLLEFGESLYGPIFEVALVGAERLLKVGATREIYFLRHLLTFLSFYAGTIVFYFLGKRFFQHSSTALLATIALVISPRIFENAFYNSKDIPCLVFFTLSIWTLFRYLDKRDYWSLVFHAIAGAILITVRIAGLLVFILTIYFLALELLEKKPDRLANIRTVGSKLLLFLVATGIFVYSFWPILWTDTLLHIRQALGSMSHFQWDATVRFMGRDLPADQIPWTYAPVWILITTPIFYTILFIIGAVWTAVELGIQWSGLDENTKKKRIAVFSWFFGPLLIVIMLKSTLYDSWRHLFFIYPAFLLLAFWGWETLWNWAVRMPGKYRVLRYTLAATLSLTYVWISYTMVTLHPYEQLYFNPLAGENMEVIRSRYDLDYWGLSYYKGLEYLAKHDPGKEIKVEVETNTGVFGTYLLSAEDQARFQFVESEDEAAYYITNYRWKLGEPYTNEIYSVLVKGIKILSVYKIK